MSIGQDIDKALVRIKKAEDRELVVIERSKQQESELIKAVWKACDALLKVAGKPWAWSVPQGLKLEIAGYEISCNNSNDCKWLSIERLSDSKSANFHPPQRLNSNDRYYSFSCGDRLFCEEIFQIYPEIIYKMAAAYAEVAEKNADMIEAREEVGLSVLR